MMRADLNDLAWFAEVVQHGGFAAAGRALGEPKSKLSRRVAALETRLGVRLIERSSRQFRVTETGRLFYERCRAMQREAEQAEALVMAAQSEPAGLIRFACPTGLVEAVSAPVTGFLRDYPKVRLHLIALDRPVDLIAERIDLALRVRTSLEGDAALTMRSLGPSKRILVASPGVAAGIGGIEDLDAAPLLATGDEQERTDWRLETSDGRSRTIRRDMRMGCADFPAVRAAAIAGLGVALLPGHACAAALADGRLVRVLPEWRGQEGLVHLVFTTRRGLPPAVRRLIDALVAGFPREVSEVG